MTTKEDNAQYDQLEKVAIQLKAENDKLKARLAQYEPATAAPIEFPKLVHKRDKDGNAIDERLVQNKAEQDKLGKGWE